MYPEETLKKLPAELRAFLEDISCLEQLKRWTDQFNIFDVLKISNMEIRHSNMLAWLLDPSETHGWGDSFLKGFLEAFQGSYTWIDEKLLQQCGTFTVRREYRNIDLLLVSEECRTVIAIENKVYSSEHSNQLGRYYDTVCKDFDHCLNKLFIYLTIDGEEASHESWETFSYENILEIIERIKLSHSSTEQVRCLINHYIAILRRIIMKDEELREICNTIYAKHKKALDIINEYKTSDFDYLIEMIREEFNNIYGILPFEKDREKRWTHFHTTAMDKFLPQLSVDEDRWNSWRYCYEIHVNENKRELFAHMALSSKNTSGEKRKMIEEIIKNHSLRHARREKLPNAFGVDGSKLHLPIPEDKELWGDLVKKAIQHLLDFEREKVLPLLTQN